MAEGRHGQQILTFLFEIVADVIVQAAKRSTLSKTMKKGCFPVGKLFNGFVQYRAYDVRLAQ